MKDMFFAFLLAATIALTGESSVVYRGRLVRAENPRAVCPFEPDTVKTMTFTVYDGTANHVCDITQDVPIEANGLFTAILDDPQLQASITNGTATEIGLRIGNAKEIQPRRKLLPTLRAETVARAAGLARKATVGTLVANDVTSQNLRVDGNLVLGKGVRSADGKPVKRFAYRISPSAGNPLNVKTAKDGTVSVFGKAQNLTPEYGDAKNTYLAGATIASAPEDGVATITCTDSLPYGDSLYSSCGAPCCSTVVFCKKGDAIKVPSGWRCSREDRSNVYVDEPRHFAVRFHPFIKK